MTTSPALRSTRHGPALVRAVRRATLAPSIHNTQPWRFVVSDGGIDVFADATRQLSVIDPQQRALVISCGAAVFGARTSLSASGLRTRVDLLPDPDDLDHLARLRITAVAGSHAHAEALDAAADRRHTNRRSLSPRAVEPAVVSILEAAADDEGAALRAVTDGVDQAAVTGLVTEAERALMADPAYRAELRIWAGRAGRWGDGVPARSFPAAAQVAHVVPGRDFDMRGTGRLRYADHAPGRRTTFLLTTANDDRRAWLDAGQALAHVLLEVARQGLVAALFTQLVEVPAIRGRVRAALDLTGYPHVLLDVGHAELAPATPRRRLAQVLQLRSGADPEQTDPA